MQKIASRSTAEIADFVDYEVRLRNTSSAALSAVSIRNTLPRGFSLVSGSARQNGAIIENPLGAPGQILTFSVGNVALGAEIRLTYRTRLGAGISSGDNPMALRLFLSRFVWSIPKVCRSLRGHR